jgi:hypothetical protein
VVTNVPREEQLEGCVAGVCHAVDATDAMTTQQV